MIVVKTEKKPVYKIGNNKQNYYICPKCKAEIAFGAYIRTICEKCDESLDNIEKLLDDPTNTSKINYYINGKI